MAAPSAAAVLDLLSAARSWRRSQGLVDNGQLFLAGYSEGGYVTMAAHRTMQAGSGSGPSPHLASLVAAVPGAGPYHLGVTMDELLHRVKDDHPVLGALISPGFLKNLDSSVRREVRRLLLRGIVPDDADVSFQTTFLDTCMADDDAAMERQSNVHDWRPDAPVALFHGRADQTVPYASATRTLQAMQARAAPQVGLSDCAAVPADHLPCVVSYWAFMLGHSPCGHATCSGPIGYARSAILVMSTPLNCAGSRDEGHHAETSRYPGPPIDALRAATKVRQQERGRA